MLISLLLFKKIIELFVIILFGFILVKTGIIEAKEMKTISKITLYVVSPCVIIDAFQFEYTSVKMQGLLLAFAVAIMVHIIFAISIGIFGKLFNMNEVEKTSIMYPNAGNLIIPIVMSVLGKEWILYCSAYVSVQMLLVFTHCKFILSGEKRFSIRQILANVNIIAIIMGILLFVTKIKLPSVLGNAMGSVGGMIGPLSMLITGMIIANMNVKKLFANTRVYFIALQRLIVFPLIILLFIKFSGIANLVKDGHTILLITFLATMAPSASTVIQMAQLYDRDSEYAGAINLITTLSCVISMPFMVWLYGILID